MMFARDWREKGMVNYCLIGTDFLFRMIKKLLEIYGAAIYIMNDIPQC